MKLLNSIRMGGRELLPLIEGGKGVSATNHASSGAWAAAGGLGTVSAVHADSYDAHGNVLPLIYHSKTRPGRHDNLVAYGLQRGVDTVTKSRDLEGDHGRTHNHVLLDGGGAP